MSEPNSEFLRAQRLRGDGRLQDALAILEDLVRRYPALPAAREQRGVTLCGLDRFDEGLADLRAAVAMEPGNADFHCDLGFMLFVADRGDEARAALERALALRPAHALALANLSLVLRTQGDFAGAEAAARQALRVSPQTYQAHINLAYALLAQGKFSEAWPHHSYRPAPHVNLRDPHLAAVVPHAQGLPAAPSALVVHGEQGLGDTLFFLRFAPRLRDLGHRLAFWGDARLHPVLATSALFEHFLRPESTPAAGLAVVWAGDLPYLLGEDDPARFPPALPLRADEPGQQALRRHLEGLGPAPYIGLTWRAGLPRANRIVLSKAIDPAILGGALAGVPGTFISLQRAAQPGELARLATARGGPIHDAGGTNDRLGDAFALLAALDDYVAVSNTNLHLRASTGRAARVLVPWPPEWRWQDGVVRSPWFAAMSLYRQDRGADWGGALAALRADLLRAGTKS